jgi:aminoglycoside phosphotransferase (APT) family kinase protein
MEHEGTRTIDAFRAAIERFIATRAGVRCEVRGLKLLAGGASQEAWSLDASIAEGPIAGTHHLVLRRDMGGALSSAVLSRDQEYLVLQAAHEAGVLVPKPYWFVPSSALLDGDRSAFLMERLDGETIGRRIVQDPGLQDARESLPAELGTALAKIHSIRTDAPELQFLNHTGPGQSSARTAIDRLVQDLDAIDEPHPALEIGLQWLQAHDPGPGDLVLLHGDYRIGNVVVGREGLRGILDWESAHIGDPHADLAWPSVRAWRFGMDTLPFGGIGPREPFIRAYEQASGRRVSRFRLFYWEVLGNMRWAIGALGQARRHLSGLERSIELASLGRIAAEMELEVLNLIDQHGSERRDDA